MEQGTIRTLTDRGYGFISRGEGQKDVFFHAKELKGVSFNELKTGDVVSFEVVENEKGLAAVGVARASN